MADKFSILSWNVRGLNCPVRHEVVRNLVQSARLAVCCLQETKVAMINNTFASEVLGQGLAGLTYLPTNHTRGGILVA
jgi:exonuclease III